MGCGLPEYLLLFRKQQTDLSKGFADEPVTRDKQTFTRAKWQAMAHSFWKSSGNRMLKLDDMSNWQLDRIISWFKQWNFENVYDWNMHVELGEALDNRKKLPSSFMALAPQSWHDGVWTDVSHMRGLNAEQNRNKVEKHICPLPFDIVERVIDNWSTEGDTVLDPFAGLFTVPYLAVKMGRKAIGIELAREYYDSGLKYMKSIEYKATIPTLFDLIESEQSAAV